LLPQNTNVPVEIKIDSDDDDDAGNISEPLVVLPSTVTLEDQDVSN
jgi:P pilus assembly chaperone PapD